MRGSEPRRRGRALGCARALIYDENTAVCTTSVSDWSETMSIGDFAPATVSARRNETPGIRPRARRRFAVGDPFRKMAPRTPTGDHVGDDEDAPLLRSRTSARPNAAVWMSVSMVVAGALVLAVGAAPSVLTTGMALVNGATYHPESAAAEAAVLEAEVIQPDGGMLRRENERDQRRDVEAAIEVLDETEADAVESEDGAVVDEAGEEEEAEERRSVEKKQKETEAEKEHEEPM